MQIKTYLLALVAILIHLSGQIARASQADNVTITITSQTAGPTPFIRRLQLLASQTNVLKSVRFEVKPRLGSVTRPLSGTYSRDYLVRRGYLNAASGTIVLPVYGLYAGSTNLVTLTYGFSDGSSKQASVTIRTGNFSESCGYARPTVVQARTSSTTLSYDYILVKGSCSNNSPTILDTDSVIRWVGTTGVASYNLAFFDNAVYIADHSLVYRNDLDGTVTVLGDYANIGVTEFHHNIDRGKVGLLLEADTASYFESTIVEIDSAGGVLNTWNVADIFRAAMIAGGDDPSQFVYPSPTDWFHNNAVAYNRADDSLVVSSREDFVVCIDYDTKAIKWILGDQTKKWFQFASLRQYALALTPGSLPPIGQHASSITYDQGLLLFDNGTRSSFHIPLGTTRSYASPRKYRLDVKAKTAAEVWNYPMGQSVNSAFCGSVYEDAPLNYLIDYAFIPAADPDQHLARLVGLDATNRKIFDYIYPSDGCQEAFNSVPLHLERTAFPTVQPRPLNLSARGTVGAGEKVLIGGFVLTGTDPKAIALRALGPSLGHAGLSQTVADPRLTLFSSSGVAIARNDDWRNDSSSSFIRANGLAPGSPSEAALFRNLTPGAYTFVVDGKSTTEGTALVEAYDLSPGSDSKLANVSSRGQVTADPKVLISGFIVGQVDSATIVIRALGPSLRSAGVSNPLSDPMLTVYNTNGAAIAHNDNWSDDASAREITTNNLAPPRDKEAATILHLPAGAYTAIVRGTNGATGVGLVEVYELD